MNFVRLEKIFAPLEKCVGQSLKLLDMAQKIWAALRKFFAPRGVPSWLRTWAKPTDGLTVLTNSRDVPVDTEMVIDELFKMKRRQNLIF